MKSTLRFVAPAAILLFASAAAQACSSCMIADPKTAGTYLGMTLMMSALPIGLVGGLAYWLWHRY